MGGIGCRGRCGWSDSECTCRDEGGGGCGAVVEATPGDGVHHLGSSVTQAKRRVDRLGVDLRDPGLQDLGERGRVDSQGERAALDDHPQGLADVARWLHDLYPGPIWITENGTADNSDSFRSRYLYDHLRAIAGSGLPIERYYHWCFVDNWEWAEGEVPRFGIVDLDYATLERTVKSSGSFYADVIAEGGVTDEIAARYLSS